MNILVTHQITDPEAYWGVLGANPAVPAGFKVVTFMAGTNPSESACLWSAPDIDSLKALVDKTVGHASNTTTWLLMTPNHSVYNQSTKTVQRSIFPRGTGGTL